MAVFVKTQTFWKKHYTWHFTSIF